MRGSAGLVLVGLQWRDGVFGLDTLSRQALGIYGGLAIVIVEFERRITRTAMRLFQDRKVTIFYGYHLLLDFSRV